MGSKALGISMALILAGMGSWIYFYELGGDLERKEAELQKRSVFKVEQGEIRGLSVENQHGKFEFTHDGGEWLVQSPKVLLANQALLRDLTRELSDLTIDRTLPDAATRLHAYGLETPESTVMLKTAAGDTQLALGGPAPFSGQYYARLGDSTDILLLSALIKNHLGQDLAGFRNKQAIEIQVPEVRGIKVTGIDRPDVIAALEDGRWQSKTPGSDFRLEERAIQEFLVDLKQLQAQRFFDNPTEVIQKLPDPQTIIELQSEGQSTPQILKVYVTTTESDPEVITLLEGSQEPMVVDPSIQESLFFTIDNLRDRTPVPFARWSVDFIEIKGGDKVFTAEREEFDWIVKDKSTWSAQDITQILDFLNTAESEIFLDIADQNDTRFGLKAPGHLQFTLKNSHGKKSHHFTVAKGENEKTFVAVNGDATLYRVESRLYTDIAGLLGL